MTLLYSGYYLETISFVEEQLISSENKASTLISIYLMLIEAEAYYYCNNFKMGFLVIKSASDLLSNTLAIEDNEYLNLKIYIAVEKGCMEQIAGNFDQAEEHFDYIISKYMNNTGNFLEESVLIKVLIQRGYNYALIRNKALAFTYLEQALQKTSLSENNFEKAEVYYYLGLVYALFYEIEQSLEYLNKSRNIQIHLSNYNKGSWIAYTLAQIKKKQGKLKEAIKSIVEVITSSTTNKNKLLEFLAYKELGDVFTYQGELEKALYNLQNAELGFQEYDLYHFQGLVLNKIGSIKSNQGLFEESFYFHKKALTIFESISDHVEVARTYDYIGKNEFVRGDFDSAYVSWQQAESYYSRLKYKIGLSYCYLNLAKICLILNNQYIEDYYVKALSLAEELNLNEVLIESFIGYGIFYVDRNYLNQANECFTKATGLIKSIQGNNIKLSDRIYQFGLLSIDYSLGKGHGYVDLILDLLSSEEQTKKVQLRKDFILAFKNKLEKNIRDQAKALDSFEAICSSDIDFYTRILAYLNRFEILIFEVKIFGTEELLVEANNVIEELISLASLNNLSSWAAKALALKGGLELVKLQFEESKNLFKEALRIAKIKNLKRVEISLNNQYDEFLIKTSKISILNEQNNTIQERLKITELSVFDSNKYYSQLEVNDEIPAYLSIIDAKGITLFSFNFQIDKNQDNTDQLISGFIIAINSVIQKIFSSTGFLERIKHKEYTLSINNITDSIYVCYGYKGQSYKAQKKIELFIEKLISNELLDSLLNSSDNQHTLNKSETLMVAKMVNEIFTKVSKGHTNSSISPIQLK